MTNEEQAYMRGQSNAYNDVFKAFATAFANRQDIHDVFARLTAQWVDVLAAHTMQDAL